MREPDEQAATDTGARLAAKCPPDRAVTVTVMPEAR